MRFIFRQAWICCLWGFLTAPRSSAHMHSQSIWEPPNCNRNVQARSSFIKGFKGVNSLIYWPVESIELDGSNRFVQKTSRVWYLSNSCRELGRLGDGESDDVDGGTLLLDSLLAWIKSRHYKVHTQQKKKETKLDDIVSCCTVSPYDIKSRVEPNRQPTNNQWVEVICVILNVGGHSLLSIVQGSIICGLCAHQRVKTSMFRITI